MNQRRTLAMAATALLFTACVSATAPTASLPSASLGASPTVVPGATTLAPGETATPTAPPTAPTDTPTAPSTTPPTTPQETPTAPPTAPPTTPPPPTYGTAQAGGHIGELATVCGHVNATNFVPTEIGIPTFLNLDSAYPTQTFNIVIWGAQRVAFENPPEIKFLDKDVCVTGVIQQYQTWLQIQAGKPQINLQP